MRSTAQLSLRQEDRGWIFQQLREQKKLRLSEIAAGTTFTERDRDILHKLEEEVSLGQVDPELAPFYAFALGSLAFRLSVSFFNSFSEEFSEF